MVLTKRKSLRNAPETFRFFSRNVSFVGNPSYNKHTDPTKLYNARLICLQETRLKEAFQICHEGITSGHRESGEHVRQVSLFYQLETRLED